MDFPNAIDYEKKLLSAMMLKGGVAIPSVTEKLSADDFYRPEHRIIFNAIVAVYNRLDAPIDPVLVLEELNRTGDLKRVDAKYFLSLVDQEFTTARALVYAETIKEKAVKRRIIDLSEGLKQKAYTEVVTVEQLMTDVEKFLFKSDDDESTFEPSHKLAALAYERTAALNKTQGLTGVATGLWDLNKATNGLQKGELILLAARPSMGKTALALNIAQGAANSNKVVAVFSLEMSKLQIGIRLLSAISGVESTKISTGKNVSNRDFERLISALEDMEEHPVYVDDTSGLSVANVRMKLRRFKQEHGLDLVIIDYLQLMSGSGENRVQEISGISRGLKSLAKEFDVPVLALSQLSRNVEMRAEKKPQLSDLRESGSLEQDADIVMFLYRDEYYNRDETDNENLAELIIAKNRNGAIGSLTLFFRKETLRFSDYLREVPRKETA